MILAQNERDANFRCNGWDSVGFQLIPATCQPGLYQTHQTMSINLSIQMHAYIVYCSKLTHSAQNQHISNMAFTFRQILDMIWHRFTIERLYFQFSGISKVHNA